MRTILDFVTENWVVILVPVLVFAFSLIVLFWIRKLALDRLERWSRGVDRAFGIDLVADTRGPAALLSLILSVYLALLASRTPTDWKVLAGDVLWTLFVAAVAITLINLASRVTFFYGRKLNVPARAVFITRNVVRITIVVVALLIVLDIWGAPTSPILLLIAILALAAAVLFRDAAPNLFAGFQLASNQQIKVGDYVKLEGGEEGYILGISWNQTRLERLEGGTVLVPNTLLLRQKVINYGHPLKKAKRPFSFYAGTPASSSYVAHDLREFVEALRKISPGSLHFHLFEARTSANGAGNDFCVWLEKEIGERELAATIAAIDLNAHSLEELRSLLIQMIEKRIK